MQIKLKTKKLSKNNRLLTLFIVTGCLITNLSYTSAQKEGIISKQITIEQGLSNYGVTDIVQDQKGFMWFATMDGLNRYDGYTFKILKPNPDVEHSLTASFVNNLYFDSYGLLWINNASFLYRYNDKNNSLNRLLPDTWLTTMCEDTLNSFGPGMWFATYGQGLYWWNKNEDKFTRFVHKTGDTKSLISDSLLCVLTDADGKLWIGTSKGLNSLNKSRKNFKHYLNGPKGQVYDINADQFMKKGLVWIGAENGLYSYDVKTDRFNHYINPFAGRNNRNDNDSRTLYLDTKGILWVGMVGGIAGFDTRKNKYFIYDNEDQSYPWAYITKAWIIQEDKYGTIWALAHGAGAASHPLLRFDNLKNRFIKYPSIPGQTIYAYSMYFDKLGTLWLGTADRGVLEIDANKKPFHNHLNTSELNRNYALSISGFSEDSTGKVWIGSTDGLYSFNRQSGKLIHYVHSDRNTNSLSSNYVNAVMADHSGNIWIGSYGLDLFESKKNKFFHFIHNPADSNSISSNDIVSLLESQDGIIWIAMSNGTLDEYSPISKVFKHHYPVASAETFGRMLWFAGLVEDQDGLIWLSITGAGLISYNRKSNTFTYYTSPPKPYKFPVKISTLGLWALCVDKKNNLWMGTELGAVELNRIYGDLSAVTEQNGITSQYIHAISEDNGGNIWLGTAKGISRFDPVSKKSWNYDKSDGLAMGIINIGAVYKTREGEMYFGGNNGFVHFFPDSIKDNSYIPPVVITSFKNFNAEVKLDSSISFKKNIYLTYQENNLSFEFTSLNYSSPEKNQYAYMMEGLDKNWVYSGTRRYASYSNLQPGKYIFRAKGSNNDGVWNEKGTALVIIISPPWWKTWWAYSSYFLIFIFSLYVIRNYEMSRLRLKDKVKMDEAVLAEREETDKMKSRFFANISHEFRTPLTLILGPAEKISTKTSDNIVKDANIIKRNSRRLLQLINQLLDLSKLEAGKLKLEAAKGNIVSFVKGVALSFESLAESKDIILKLLPEKEYIELFFDKEKMTKILTNILSNAFKFTPEEGMITVSVKESSSLPGVSQFNWDTPGTGSGSRTPGKNLTGFVEIKIRDTGIGIAKEEISKLFDRFYQVDSSLTREYEGSGIGLALTKELVELHRGKIYADSEQCDPNGVSFDLPGQQTSWTEFTLLFPIGKAHLHFDEIIGNEKTIPVVQIDEIASSFSNRIAEKLTSYEQDFKSVKEKTIILIVEDNYDMREYIKESLVQTSSSGNNDYLFEEAVNGEQGVRKAEKIIPDIIISDMMMPKMDGNELVKILKNDEKTCHIPIILLTAKAGNEDKIESLETGADDYLTKPFDIKELQVRVRNLINIRKKLQEKFSRPAYLLPAQDDKKGMSIDEKFMFKVREIIEKHISEEGFNIEDFCYEVAMSRAQLHRKLKALTGKSASLYIRSVKLAKAKKMIEEQTGNISEIAYSVGFSSPAYFSRCFKEEFGYPPSDVIN